MACTLTLFGSTVRASVSEIGSEAIVPAQQAPLRGTVVDQNGAPIVGASIIEVGTTNGTMTDADGSFSIALRSGNSVTISCIGYAEQTVVLTDGMRIVLAEDTEFLEEVVVVGYGTQKKANLTGAVSTVDVGKTLEAKSMVDLGKSLQGAVPGLTIINSNGKIGNAPSIRIRGVGTLSNDAASDPLYIVDGVPIDDISYLNTQDIESISVLKDAASASIYGTRAAFGVVLIKTKSALTEQRVLVNYTNNFGWNQATVLPEHPSVMEQITGLNQVNKRMG